MAMRFLCFDRVLRRLVRYIYISVSLGGKMDLIGAAAARPLPYLYLLLSQGISRLRARPLRGGLLFCLQRQKVTKKRRSGVRPRDPGDAEVGCASRKDIRRCETRGYLFER